MLREVNKMRCFSSVRGLITSASLLGLLFNPCLASSGDQLNLNFTVKVSVFPGLFDFTSQIRAFHLYCDSLDRCSLQVFKFESDSCREGRSSIQKEPGGLPSYLDYVTPAINRQADDMSTTDTSSLTVERVSENTIKVSFLETRFLSTAPIPSAPFQESFAMEMATSIVLTYGYVGKWPVAPTVTKLSGSMSGVVSTGDTEPSYKAFDYSLVSDAVCLIKMP